MGYGLNVILVLLHVFPEASHVCPVRHHQSAGRRFDVAQSAAFPPNFERGRDPGCRFCPGFRFLRCPYRRLRRHNHFRRARRQKENRKRKVFAAVDRGSQS